MKFISRSLFRTLAPQLSLVLVSLVSPFPAALEAAQAGGGTTTTMTLTYLNGVKKWVMRIDPLNVQAFQLDIMFDPTRAQLDQTIGLGGVLYIFPFNQTTLPDKSALGAGLLRDVAGAANPLLTSPGDVDIFELQFFDLQPALPISGVAFTVFASPNDYIVGYDPATMQSIFFDYTEIAPTTRTVLNGGVPVSDGGGTVALLVIALIGLTGLRTKLPGAKWPILPFAWANKL